MMQPLDKSLRAILERTIRDARDIAEDAARAALEQIGVGEATPFAHLSEHDRELRRKLRVHGRQLGDSLSDGNVQTMDRLVEEFAYEHWHRMLFARFLAENNLLMYPDPVDPVAVTLEECEDLAADEGAKSGWELAARFAARMLPQIFRIDSPVFQLILPPEYQQKLEKLVAGLPVEVFTASDSLGWVYQFWQAKKKDAVNKSEVKIGARELPAVTQLFTEPYMVSFLLDNSLGAWWAARRLSEDDLKNAKSEDELRKKAAIPGVTLEYLRFVKKEDGVWTPAAGTFEKWPKNLSELKTLDPCCGSGHFIVATFLMLVPFRMELEGLSAKDAVDAVLRENIYGLELDQRCVELAAFALALAAWKYPGISGYRVLPELNVACSGLSISAKKNEWLALAGKDTNLQLALEELYNQFKDASVLGSLIDPDVNLSKGPLFQMRREDILPVLTMALKNEGDIEKTEMAVVALGVSKAALLLSEKYQLVTTNVPYRSLNDLSETIRYFSMNRYSDGATDLATVFLLRILNYLTLEGNCSSVIPQNWLVQPTYKDFRRRLLNDHGFRIMARLGPGAFQEITGEVVNPLLLSVDLSHRHNFFVLDCGRKTIFEEKAECLKSNNLNKKSNTEQLKNPDSVIHLAQQSNGISFLGNFASSIQGVKTGEDDRYKRMFWEFSVKTHSWIWYQSTTKDTSEFGGLEHVLFWNKNGEHLARKQGLSAWGKQGVAVSQIFLLCGCSIF